MPTSKVTSQQSNLKCFGACKREARRRGVSLAQGSHKSPKHGNVSNPGVHKQMHFKCSTCVSLPQDPIADSQVSSRRLPSFLTESHDFNRLPIADSHPKKPQTPATARPPDASARAEAMTERDVQLARVVELFTKHGASNGRGSHLGQGSEFGRGSFDVFGGRKTRGKKNAGDWEDGLHIRVCLCSGVFLGSLGNDPKNGTTIFETSRMRWFEMVLFDQPSRGR